MLWLVLLSPLGALMLLVLVQRFEARVLASVPRRARTRPQPLPRPPHGFRSVVTTRPNVLPVVRSRPTLRV